MKALPFLMAGLLVLSTPARADMTGGHVQVIGPGVALPGQIVNFLFQVENLSQDGEATSSIHLRFPETFRVLDAWVEDGGQGWDLGWVADGDFGERVIFYDSDNDPDTGEILPGQSGILHVQVEVSANTDCGIYSFGWKQYGDGQGKHPHYVLGDLPYDVCGIAVAPLSFSSVKSLY